MPAMKPETRSGFAAPTGDMSGEDFRRYGHQLVDWISDYFASIEERPVLAQVKPGELMAQLPSSPPAGGESMDDILADVDRLIVPALTHWNHPSFFALFSTSTSAPGIFGELLSAAFDVKSMLWRTSPAATELEQVALDWLRQMMGLDAGMEGIIYDTASVSTMHAIAAARETVNLRIRELGMTGRTDLPLLRVYASDEVHTALDKGLIALGLGQRALQRISMDAEFRMDPRALEEAIEQDLAAGHLPFCVVATIGTTSASSVDPIPEIAEICKRHNLWLHIDAAYAGSAAILPEKQQYFAGCELADSLVTNPHKWLFTPFDLSVLYCRRMDMLRQAFSLTPEVLKTNDSETVRNGMDYGVQLGRRFRALKLWFIIRYFGHEGLAARIREHCRLAELFASWVVAEPRWELMAPVPFGLVCFRYVTPRLDGESDEDHAARMAQVNESAMNRINAGGEAYLSHTKLKGKFTLRLAIGNIRTEERHIQQVWDALRNMCS
jgi:aromatic-L-amino-acid decarboxylase